MDNDLNRRNTESAFQAIRDVDARERETRAMLDTMNLAISTLNSRVTELETTINNIRISTMGNGPTQK